MAVKKDKKSRNDSTIFQEKSKFRGILNYKKPLEILGQYEGEITGSALLEVGPNAKIDAHIDTTHLIIFGKVKGNIVASERVELRQGATVVGNIKTPSIEIDDGVVFEGQCEMQKK